MAEQILSHNHSAANKTYSEFQSAHASPVLNTAWKMNILLSIIKMKGLKPYSLM